MADDKQLLEKARELGKAIAAHESVKAFLTARDAAMKDDAAQRLLGDYQRQADRIGQFEAENKPIEVADKHKLRDLETAMAGHPTLKILMRTQADYSYLMVRIHQAMEEPLNPKGD